MMDVSVVIPSYNTQDTIIETLSSLQSQKTYCEFEVILVDCSEHSLVREKAAGFPFVKIIHRTERFNPGEGRNIGSRQACGSMLMFTDADIKLTDTAVQNAWQKYNEGYRIFGGALELNKQTSSGPASYLEHYFFNHEAQAGRPTCERSNLSSALMCVDRELFLREGGFKDIPRMQDTEFTESLRSKENLLYFFPDILAYQTQDSCLKKVLKKIFVNGQNLYYIRYRPRITLLKKGVFFFALPVLGLLKITRIIYRHLRYQSMNGKITTLCLLVPLLFSIFFWIGGFYHALITEKGISTQR